MDSPAALFLALILAVTAWFVLRWLIVAVWGYTDILIGASRKPNQPNGRETLEDNVPKEESEPSRKEWEEQGVSFQEWLDYSDAYRTPRGEGIPPDSYYEQFKSYKPPQPRDKRPAPPKIPKPRSRPYPSSRTGDPISPEVVHVPDFPSRRFSPLVTRFIKENVHVYHFTDSTNLESIQRLGLLPKSHFNARSLRVTYLSDDLSRSLDDQRGLSDFIHLSFHPDHSMLRAAQYRTSGSVLVLAVSLEALDRQGCCFTRALANSNGAVRIPMADISDSDFRHLKSGTYESKKWQLLVPGLIPWRLLRVEATHQGLSPLWH